ncbi:MAG TPA: type IV pilus biogenesis/stability protein PilW [Pseudomonadales bacterium]|nr:type IV pilus biogenesis/stability protein PilW [Pseudomonadales bacterium]
MTNSVVIACRRALLIAVAASIVACSGASNVKTESVTNPDVLHKKVQLGKSYIQNGNFERARFHLRDALKLAPESAEVHDALALMFMATDEMALADDYFQKSLSREPNNSRYRNNYASFLMSQQRYSDAAQQFQRVVDDVLYENRTDAMVSLAVCKLEMHEESAAADLFSKVLRFNRLHPVALYYTSLMHYQAGSISMAYNYWQRLTMSSSESAASLLLGIKIAEAQGRDNDAASMAMRLSSLFGQSPEYREYQNSH